MWRMPRCYYYNSICVKALHPPIIHFRTAMTTVGPLGFDLHVNLVRSVLTSPQLLNHVTQQRPLVTQLHISYDTTTVYAPVDRHTNSVIKHHIIILY